MSTPRFSLLTKFSFTLVNYLFTLLSSAGSMSHTTEQLLEAFLSTTSNDIIPLTAKGVASGCKVFGAAILRKSDLSLVIAATNDETTSPLLVSELPEWEGNGGVLLKATHVARRDQLYPAILGSARRQTPTTKRLRLLRDSRALLAMYVVPGHTPRSIILIVCQVYPESPGQDSTTTITFSRTRTPATPLLSLTTSGSSRR
jgi:hypothetical protein